MLLAKLEDTAQRVSRAHEALSSRTAELEAAAAAAQREAAARGAAAAESQSQLEALRAGLRQRETYVKQVRTQQRCNQKRFVEMRDACRASARRWMTEMRSGPSPLPLSLQMEGQLLAAEARMEELVRESMEDMEQKQQLLDECARSLAAEHRADQAEVRALSPSTMHVGFPHLSAWLRGPAEYMPRGSPADGKLRRSVLHGTGISGRRHCVWRLSEQSRCSGS
jgi:hypothetical protein